MVVLHGKELFLRQEETSQLMAALRQIHGEVDVFTFTGSDANAADVLDECRSFGLIASHKVIIVDEADELVKKDTRPLFERYAQSPCDGTTLILRSGNWKAGKLDKMVAKVGRMIACKEFSEHEAITWAGRRATAVHGVKINRDAAAALIERVGVGLGRIDSELAKLAVGADRGVISLQLVQELVAATKALEPWPLQEALLSGNAEQGIRYIRNTISTAPRGIEIPLIFAATTLARDLHACTIAQQLRIAPHEVAARTNKRFPRALDQIYPRTRRLNPLATARLVSKCVQADAHSKSGVGRADRSLEMLAVRFARLMR